MSIFLFTFNKNTRPRPGINKNLTNRYRGRASRLKPGNGFLVMDITSVTFYVNGVADNFKKVRVTFDKPMNSNYEFSLSVNDEYIVFRENTNSKRLPAVEAIIKRVNSILKLSNK